MGLSAGGEIAKIAYVLGQVSVFVDVYLSFAF